MDYISFLEELKLHCTATRNSLKLKTCFRKANDLDVKWTANQPYTIRNGNLYVTPTNFRSISYLDLNEFSFDGLAHMIELQQYSKTIDFIYRQNQLMGRYLLECHQRKRDSSDLKKHIVVEFQDRSHYRILLDGIRLIRSLSKRPKLKNFFDRLTILQKNFMRKRMRKIVFHWKYPRITVSHFKTLCVNPYFRDDLFSTSLTTYLCLFLEHSHAADFDARTFLCDLWRRERKFDYFSPLQWALEKTDSEELRFFLNAPNMYKFPFILTWIGEQYPVDDDTLWPLLGVYGASQTYFQSNEFKTRLVYDILISASNALDRMNEDMISRVLIVFRAIPTPYLRMRDLRECFERAMKHLDRKSASSNNHHIRLWKILVRVFPKDCLSEVYQPRSLMHLARCAVRQVVPSRNRNSLQKLPQYLQDYVKLKF